MDIGNHLPLSLIFLLILTIAGNYTGDLMNCQIQYSLKNNRAVQNISAFLTLLFFIVLSNSKLKFEKALLQASYLYAFFIIISKCELSCFLVIILLLMTSCILRKYIVEGTYNEKTKTLKIVDSVVLCLTVPFVIFGVVVYYGKKKIEYGDNFKFLKFWFPTKLTCAGNHDGGDPSKRVSMNAALKCALLKKCNRNAYRIVTNSQTDISPN
tara:strand:- start:3571 stop:4203 length:633 start_codon:yes stop_codon:yes gene_type:complete